MQFCHKIFLVIFCMVDNLLFNNLESLNIQDLIHFKYCNLEI